MTTSTAYAWTDCLPTLPIYTTKQSIPPIPAIQTSKQAQELPETLPFPSQTAISISANQPDHRHLPTSIDPSRQTSATPLGIAPAAKYKSSSQCPSSAASPTRTKRTLIQDPISS
ncbi:hypothetical protein ASPSYDRAFT_44911 [Aspergillus sydowii CBS 593.65]|uniref:Uncharacterized protein n=1 Tax=Aspergillus sydowii CBS 593.65 TaxID=1036612 RepID=A0A1L9TGK2_9EURO|nr:uncharacterized protein ASPSYDRAFT_44911 [Aspergillus sydowii CBS 593.65]OJJ58542.1 hypothetical protein ASPSYDRAFT_44911 [Aspergillus sydowii CBS 593.65]